MSKKKTVFLPAFHSLTIVADSISSGEVFQINSGANSSNHVAISASSTTVIDPIATPRTMAIRSDTGLLVETIAPGVAVSQDETPELAGDLDLNSKNIDFPTTQNISDVIDDDTFAAATATNLATAESIKAYVDSHAGGIGSADDLTDVTITTPEDGQILHYNTGEFVNYDSFNIGVDDAYSRKQIHFYDTDAVLRLGASSANGDSFDSTSEGAVFYGNSVIEDKLEAGHAGFARIKSDRFGLWSYDTGSFENYYFRVDPTSLYLRNDSDTKTFEVDRATGNITVEGTVDGRDLATDGSKLDLI